MIWLILILALALSFLFSGIESAVMTVSRVRIRMPPMKACAAPRGCYG